LEVNGSEQRFSPWCLETIMSHSALARLTVTTIRLGKGQAAMNDVVTEGTPTSTAATQQTEKTVIAAICSGEEQSEREQAIRERAYAIWEEEGRRDGKDLDHWLRAEAEMIRSSDDAKDQLRRR
jgi:hypothetical protein